MRSHGLFSSLRSLLFCLIVGVSAATMSSWRPTLAQDAPPSLQFHKTAADMTAIADAVNRHLTYVPNQVLVKFKSGVNQSGQQRALMALRSRPAASDLRWSGDVAVLTDASQPDATILSAQLREQPEVQYAEPNYLRHVLTTPNDPSFSSKQWNFQALDMTRAWDISPGGSDSITVAIVDSGVTTVNASFTALTWNGFRIQTITVPFAVNPDLSGNRLVSPMDFCCEVGSTVLDLQGHGTHVSSTVGEDTNNSLALAGIAYRVKIMPVKVCAGYWDLQFEWSAAGLPGFFPPTDGSCTSFDVAQGIRYAADNGAKVINLSLGGPNASTTEQDAITYAVGKGVFVAIAAGNAYADGNATQYPAAFAKTIDGAMAVAAVGRSLNHAWYSSSGSYVEIAAPGGDDLDGGESGKIWQSTILQADSDPNFIIFPRFDRYAETAFEGTSMASPHIAGIAALLMSRGLTNPAAVEAVIKATARDLGAPGRDDLYGSGLVQPRTALLGFGFAK
jgi:serine protease